MSDSWPDSGHEPGEIAAIVLAAGASSRFGSNKLLHPLMLYGVTMPLAAHSLLPWLDVFEHVHVVVKPGAEAFCDEIEKALGASKLGRINWIACKDSTNGLAASIVCGVHANRDSCGWMIGLADMPAVPAAAITGVRHALQGGAELATPNYDGRRGHPVGFSSHYLDELLVLQGDTGARDLLERDKLKVVQVKVSNNGIFADIDTPGDLQSL